jgi:hypothetical protein
VRAGRGFESGGRSVRKSRQERSRELGAWRKADPPFAKFECMCEFDASLNACVSLKSRLWMHAWSLNGMSGISFV